jgi:kynurenine formamidase
MIVMKPTNALVAIVVAASLWGSWIASGQPAQGQPPPNLSSVGKPQFDQWMTQLSNWGRWGKDDQIGTLNLITADKRKQASAQVKTGVSVSLAHEITRDNMAQPRPSGGSLINLFRTNGEFLMEQQEMDFHGSRLSHFDALCHKSYNGKVYNGANFKDVVTEDGGCSKLAVTAAAKDGIVTRGILLDIPGVLRLRREDIDAWEKRTGIKISSGDALLLRTIRPGTARQPGMGAQGYEPSLIPFLKERDIALLGSDVIQEGGNIPGVVTPIHTFTLVALGMNLLDNLDLNALGETAARLKRWEFMLTVEPLRVQNGTGSAVNPVALF